MSLNSSHSPIFLSHPNRVVWPPSWVGHIPFAFWIIEALRPKVLVELGTHTGNSFSAFCQAIVEVKLPTRCFAVDTWIGDPQAGHYDSTVYDDLMSYLQPKYGSFISLLRMTFDEALSHFDEGSIDLLHIDGFHSYDAVAHDFSTWLPKLSRHGVVLFHDTEVRLEGYEVWRFWAEVSQQYPSLEFSHCNGLGVLLVGAEVPEPLSGLVAAIADHAAIRQFFEGLGNRVVSEYNHNDLRSLIKNHYDEVVVRDQEIHRLNAVVARASEDLISLGRMVQERDAEISRLDTAISTATAEIATLRSALVNRDSPSVRTGRLIRRLGERLFRRPPGV